MRHKATKELLRSFSADVEFFCFVVSLFFGFALPFFFSFFSPPFFFSFNLSLFFQNMEAQFRVRGLRCSDTKRILSLYDDELKETIEAGYISAYPRGIVGALATSMNRSSFVVEDIKTGFCF